MVGRPISYPTSASGIIVPRFNGDVFRFPEVSEERLQTNG